MTKKSIRPSFSCIFCGNTKGEIFPKTDAKNKMPLNVGVCVACGLVQLVDVPSDQELSDFYGSRYRMEYKGHNLPSIKSVFRAAKTASERMRKIASYAQPQARHLDVGSGGGEFTFLAQRAGLIAQGIDPSSDFISFAREAYEIKLRNISLFDVSTDESYEIVTMFHVLEHLSKPGLAIAKVHALLVDDGIFVLEVPNLESKKNSPFNTFFKAHITYFTQASLELLVSRYFKIQFVENDKNLFMVLQKKPMGDEKAELREASVHMALNRLSKKGVIDYLMHGGAISIFRKLLAVFEEKRETTGKSHRAVLERFTE